MASTEPHAILADLARATPAVLAMTGVVWGLPLLAVPMLGLLAVPIAYPALLLLVICPALTIRPVGRAPRVLAGLALLLVAGVGNVVWIVQTVDVAHRWLLGRSTGSGVGDVVAYGLADWGVLVAAASVGRGDGVPAAVGFAAAFVAVGPLACGVLALLAALGLPLGT